MTKYEKARNWGMVVYPESAPENWKELIKETHIAFAVSPLHDKDINIDGEVKKDHWHVILAWDGPVTRENVRKLAQKVGAPQPIKLESVKGGYRYFTHQDNPEKYQYDKKDIELFNGFDISNYIALTKEEKYEAVKEIKTLIHKENIKEYIDLLDVLEVVDFNLFKVAVDNTILTNAMIKSNRYKFDK